MKFYYKTDEQFRVFFASPWIEELIPSPLWKMAEADIYTFETEEGIPLWKEVNGQIVARTEEEIAKDIDEIPLPTPTDIDYLRADVDFLTMENEALEEQTEIDRADIDYLLMLVDEEEE